jgi:hypothetical protein
MDTGEVWLLLLLKACTLVAILKAITTQLVCYALLSILGFTHGIDPNVISIPTMRLCFDIHQMARLFFTKCEIALDAKKLGQIYAIYWYWR